MQAHVQSILLKLGVHSKLEAAIFALESTAWSRLPGEPGHDRHQAAVRRA